MSEIPTLGQGRTLFVSSFAPQVGSGRELRTWTVVRALAEFGGVDLAYVPFGGETPSPEFRALQDVRYHVVHSSRGLRRACRYGAVRLQGVPHALARGAIPEVTRVAARLAEAPERGLVVAGDMNAMLALRGVALRRPVAFVAHNVESSFRPSQSALERRGLQRIERRLLELAAEGWMVSHRDVALARRLAPRAHLRYVPNVVNVAGILPVEAAAGSQVVLMLGDFGYAPNRDGVRWLIEKVMPIVWTQLPAARLRLAGRWVDDVHGGDPRVDSVGFVSDVREAYAGCAAVAVPLQESGGTPLKFVEALAFGVPVVSTPIAAQGLDARPDEHFRLAAGGDPTAFAAALLDLMRHGDAEMSARARAFVVREHSVESLVRLLAA